MTLVKMITLMGLGLDIIGAVLLAKGVFFETTKELVDKGGIKPDRYRASDMVSDYYASSATRIVERCKEIFRTRIGLFLLISGFSLQLIAQVLPSDQPVSTLEVMVGLLIPVLLFGSCYLIATNYDEKLKQDALIELIDRMLPSNERHGPLVLPAGMPYSVIEKVCSIFLKRKLSFEGFAKEIDEKHRTPSVWLELERARRITQGLKQGAKQQ
ncbi:hypothetical protein [Leucothrix mucor]|uniref:hypothetical protein n=1 Tax=Leucothrix mucor TaxID=45248 RepID=UPI0003B59061|nr:hypothetical protein [Leucothrix mucor]